MFWCGFNLVRGTRLGLSGMNYERPSGMNEDGTHTELFPDMDQFEEQPQEVIQFTDWSMNKISSLNSKLEYLQHQISTTRGRGVNDPLNYSYRVIIKMANRVFGFNGWSTRLIGFDIEEDFNEADKKYSAKVYALVRVTLKDGVYREEYGVGGATNLPEKLMCYIKCKKQAVSVGTKRAILGLRDLLQEYEAGKL